jgi:serine/threonine-protein kinase
MAHDAKLVVRRADTPAGRSRPTFGRLPDELIQDQVGRLTLLSAVGCGLWSFGLLMDTVVLPTAFSSVTPTRPGTVIEIAGAVTSALTFLYFRFAPRTAETKTSAGLIYLLVNAFGVAMFNSAVSLPKMQGPELFLSWNTVVILVFAMIAFAPPLRLLVASLLAASMDPLAVWIGHLRGFDVPAPLATLALFLPNYICAVVAILPTLTLHRLGSKLRQAQELGSYRLVELLGQGGMGEVWRAEHRLLARSAAVKLVRPDVLGASSASESAQILRRFEREARATAALSSPHTIQVFDFGTTADGNFYYVMELLFGRDLESLVRDYGPMPANRAIHLLRQVCHSLADAHARGLVHRDIKPANIYVCRMGLEYDFVKVLDFGLVKVPKRDTRTETLVTGDQRTSGTPAYMAPEVILGNADVDRRADVYAMGCVAYYVLTGQLVFDADSPMKLLMRHVGERPVPPSERSEMPIPPALDELVMSCLEKDPNKRPQNAEELFQLALCCTACDDWNQDGARSWWTTHLPALCGPLTLETVDRAHESADASTIAVH